MFTHSERYKSGELKAEKIKIPVSALPLVKRLMRAGHIKTLSDLKRLTATDLLLILEKKAKPRTTPVTLLVWKNGKSKSIDPRGIDIGGILQLERSGCLKKERLPAEKRAGGGMAGKVGSDSGFQTNDLSQESFPAWSGRSGGSADDRAYRDYARERATRELQERIERIHGSFGYNPDEPHQERDDDARAYREEAEKNAFQDFLRSLPPPEWEPGR